MSAALLLVAAMGSADLDDVVMQAAVSARKARLTSAWMTFGLGAAEVVAGGVFLGALDDGPLRTALPTVLFAAGGIQLALSLPLFLQQTRVEWEADGPWTKTPADLQTALEAEDRERTASIVTGSVSLALAAGGEAFVGLYRPLPDDARAAFATTIGVVALADVVILAHAILTRPVRNTVRAQVGLSAVGVAGTF